MCVAVKLCSNCKRKPAYRGQRCTTCRAYLYNYGIERPQILWFKQAERIEKKAKAPAWCSNCGSMEISHNFRCYRCARWLHEHKRERPRHLWAEDPRCKNCTHPLPVAKGRRKTSGLCQLCRVYFNKYKKHRPKKAWGIGSAGWCDCGAPAEHKINKFTLCNQCAVDYKKGAYT